MLVNIWKVFKARPTRAATFVTFPNNRCVIIPRDYAGGGCNPVKIRLQLCDPAVTGCARSLEPTEARVFGWSVSGSVQFHSSLRMISGWQGYTPHLFEFGISNHGVSNCVIYARRPNAAYDYGPGGECRVDAGLWASRGVNGRFIYHRCHSPPERKSALPNWNIAEFTLLIRALSAVLSPRLSSKWEQRRSDT